MNRLFKILQVLTKYQLDEYLSRHTRSQFLNSGGNIFRSLFFIKKVEGPIGYRIRCALEELGPVFIKFGQLISTREDLLPKSIIDELTKLRDSTAPIDIELPSNVKDFAYFSKTPIASASVAQVHFAMLPTGEKVAVKLIKPGIREIIESDIRLIKDLVVGLQFFKSELKNLNLIDVISELEISILQELDLELELINAEKFRNNLKDYKDVLIPKMYKEWSSKDLLVMERMYGTPIDHTNNLIVKGVDTAMIATQGLELLLLQVFRDRFFHADPHSGNIWIDDSGKRIYLDFGIMGSITKETRDIAVKLLTALFTQDYIEFVNVQVQAGWFPKDIDQDTLGKLFQEVNIIGSTQNLSALNTFDKLLFLGKKYNVRLPSEFTLLAKTLVASEGIAKKIDPTMNFQRAVTPLILKHFSKHV